MLKNLKNKIIGVLYGGISKEREISLKTGEAIYNALIKLGYKAKKIDIDKNFLKKLKTEKFDIAFIALHGKYGEDGIIQSILEFQDIPYTGTGVAGSAICINKILTKRFFKSINVPTPKWWESISKKFKFPLVIKPISEGSTIGVFIVKDEKNLNKAFSNAKKISNELFFEEYIKGKEVTVSVLNGKALPVIEIIPKKGFYDYESKYTSGMTEYIIPAKIDKKLTNRLQKMSEKIYKNFNLKGAIRVDFIIKDQTPFALEINTIPGMTKTSLLPKAANYIGLSFENLIEEILKGAVND